jgi:pyruvate/2-oxoglutarate/acetoin dehydrogenase E1 component
MRVPIGGYLTGGSIYHSQSGESIFTHTPGMRVAMPSNALDALGLLRTAIRCDDPVLFLEHKRLYSLKDEVPEGDEIVALGTARIAREGSDLTIATAMKGVHDSLEAARALSDAHGIECEVIDLRTLRPLDVSTVVGSVQRTGRLLVVEEGPQTGGWAGEVLAAVTVEALGHLDDAWRLTTPEHPIPYSPVLEDAFLPLAEGIVSSVLERGSVPVGG